ncbi:LacI family DNA-binding transcriptional regulator [Tessaracoccus rhinocerotis]|nr:LacI family DNA-binding transcriptional regulator [Tessaracoccus rhinocerotis]
METSAAASGQEPAVAARVPATMKDVALLAGVSVPTVSRFLSGSANVRADKRERVAAAIQELDFTPNASARVLVGGKPKVIAAVVGNTSRYGYAETIRGLEEAARADGYVVTFTVIEEADEESLTAGISLVLSQAIAGVAVLKFDPPGVAAIKRIPEWMPVVALSGVRDTAYAQAVIRESVAARHLVEHLLELGHETVHHVRIPPSRREDGRTAGWRRALKDAGREVPEVFEASWDPQSGRDVGNVIAERDDVTAVFCGNDEIAMGVMAGLRDKGLRVPEDVSVVGFDDHPLSSLWHPALTTARQEFADMGRNGWELLKEQIHGAKDHPLVSSTPDVIIRESTAPPRGN